MCIRDSLIIIWCPEIGGINCTEIRVILFRHFGTDEKTTVLRHAYQRLSDCHIAVSYTHLVSFRDASVLTFNSSKLILLVSDPLGIGSQLSLVLAIFGEMVCSMAFIFGFLYRLAMLPMRCV